METNENHKDLEACLRTFKKLAYKIDEINTKLSHVIERLREQHIKNLFDESNSNQSFFKEYEKHDQPDEEDLDY